MRETVTPWEFSVEGESGREADEHGGAAPPWGRDRSDGEGDAAAGLSSFKDLFRPSDRAEDAMSKIPANSSEICGRCTKPLKEAACSACGGRGSYPVWIFFSRECGVCDGSGRVLRCPDEYGHILEDLNLPTRHTARSLYRDFRGIRPQAAPSAVEKQLATTRPSPQPKIPPPWHPSYPFPWHPGHPRNPRNQLFNPMNPNSPTNPANPLSPLNPNNPLRRK
jgi:hypothetical protein